MNVLFISLELIKSIENRGLYTDLLREIRSELLTDSRKFSFLCGHDSNVGSILAALDAEDYTLPGAIEAKTPIGCKLVFSLWRAADGAQMCSVDLVYQTTWQLHEMPLLDPLAPPAVHPVALRGMARSADGLYRAEDLMERLDSSIAEFDAIRQEYAEQPAA